MVKKSRFLSQQKIFALLFGIIAIGILITLFWQTYQTGGNSQIIEGRDYTLLEKPRRIRGEKIEVIEFFSYACVHCYRLEPILKDWLSNQQDKIEFVQIPAVMNEYWKVLGKHYFTLQRLGKLDSHHMDIFNAIHSSGKIFDSEKRLFDFIKTTAIEFDSYEKTFRSIEVQSDLQKANQMAKRLKIAAVPTLVVQGKYLVKTGRDIGLMRAKQVVEFLIDKELKTKQPKKKQSRQS
ncbi:MAG: hypothetical protein CMQ79_06010 [Gammaproteobacteria bacterium]|nr:hypothetical protein [Gammaproteobacteria bacterium]